MNTESEILKYLDAADLSGTVLEAAQYLESQPKDKDVKETTEQAMRSIKQIFPNDTELDRLRTKMKKTLPSRGGEFFTATARWASHVKLSAASLPKRSYKGMLEAFRLNPNVYKIEGSEFLSPEFQIIEYTTSPRYNGSMELILKKI